jgi:hypothetical protein
MGTPSRVGVLLGVVVFSAALAFDLLDDGLRDIFNPCLATRSRDGGLKVVAHDGLHIV